MGRMGEITMIWKWSYVFEISSQGVSSSEKTFFLLLLEGLEIELSAPEDVKLC